VENPPGFDLNQAIAQWKSGVGQSPAYRAEDLEELESHLHDAVERLRDAGLSEEEAFIVATRRIGPSPALETEYSKVNEGNVWRDRLLWMVVGVQAWVFIGTVANMLSRFGAWFATRHTRIQEWLPRIPGVDVPALTLVLDISINVLAIGALCALGWMWIRRIGRRPGLLRQPGWLAWRMVALCTAIFVGRSLFVLSTAAGARTLDSRAFADFALSSQVANVVLFIAQTIALAWLSVVLVRRRVESMKPVDAT
jgi:hypothetical protein